MFGADFITALARLQDDVAPSRDRRSIVAAIERAIGSTLDDVFVAFPVEPRFAASIAHVYAARLRYTDELVAVKVRRPGVDRVMAADIRLMRAAAAVVRHLPRARELPVRSAVDEVTRALEHQLSFILEAENNRTFKHVFRDTPAVHLPRLYDEWCTDDVLIMEYLDGLRRFDDPLISDADFVIRARLALHCIYRMIFTAGVIHCDLHPSNLCFSPVGVALLDTGFVSKLDDVERAQFRMFFAGIAFNDPDACTRILTSTANAQSSRFNEAAFAEAIRDLLKRTSGARAGDFSVVDFARQLFELQRDHGLRGSARFTMAIISLLVVEGLVRHRMPNIDFQREAIPHVSAGLAASGAPVAAAVNPDRSPVLW